LELRYTCKKLGNDIIPKCFKTLKYTCPEDEDDDDYTFYKHIQNASKVEIENISGSEAHLNKLREIAENVGRNCRYLYLHFDGEVDDDALA
jgi:hypothetical protein